MAKYIVSQAEDRAFELPNAGAYTATVMDCEETKSKSNDNTMFEFRLSIVGGDGEFQFREYTVFTPKMMWKVRQMLRAFGISPSEDIDIDPNDLVGKTCEIKVKHETSGNYTNLKVEEWIASKETEKPKKKKQLDEKNDQVEDDDIPF